MAWSLSFVTGFPVPEAGNSFLLAPSTYTILGVRCGFFAPPAASILTRLGPLWLSAWACHHFFPKATWQRWVAHTWSGPNQVFTLWSSKLFLNRMKRILTYSTSQGKGRLKNKIGTCASWCAGYNDVNEGGRREEKDKCGCAYSFHE